MLHMSAHVFTCLHMSSHVFTCLHMSSPGCCPAAMQENASTHHIMETKNFLGAFVLWGLEKVDHRLTFLLLLPVIELSATTVGCFHKIINKEKEHLRNRLF